MITIEKTEVFGWEAATRGLRNPMNSWDKSDSEYKILDLDGALARSNNYIIGPNDLKLMKTLSKAGPDHGKFLRMINVTCDITAPLYWLKEADTYKIGTVRNSCSTMHKIAEKEFTIEDFSHEHLTEFIPGQELKGWTLEENDLIALPNDPDYGYSSVGILRDIIIKALNFNREKYLETKDKKYWWQMIQLLPSSYNQKSTFQFNYQVLKSMYFARRNHKLDEWHDFCAWCETLPYFKEICIQEGDINE